MLLQLDDHEPHYPHCGKQHWTEAEKEEERKKVARSMEFNNRVTKTAVEHPAWLKKENLYTGSKPPWEYPTMIICVETEQQFKAAFGGQNE